MVKYNKDLKTRSEVKYIVISGDYEGHRIDKYLLSRLKGVPKSHIYRIMRKGEVRVNKKRIPPFYRLKKGDSVRLPPVTLDEKAKLVPPSKETIKLLADRILYEDEN